MAKFDDVLRVLEIVKDLGFTPEKIDWDEQLFQISEEDDGIKNMIIDCENTILVLEQVIMPVTEKTDFSKLLTLNQDLVHGAFALDDSGKLVLWRDTLCLDTLDPEELAGSINAVSLALAQHKSVLIGML